jgi:hypothetical protein
MEKLTKAAKLFSLVACLWANTIRTPLNVVLIVTTDHEIIPAGVAVGVSLAVRWTAGYRAIGKSGRHFYCYTQTENIKHFDLRVMSECTQDG